MIGALPSLIGLQAYMAHAIRNLGGLGFKAWMPFAFQTDNRIWRSNGRIFTPSTEVVSANRDRIERDRLLNAAIANRLALSRGYNATEQIGALFEGARTNEMLRNKELDNAVYNKVRALITVNDIASPDRAVTADKIVEDTTASSTHLIGQDISYISGNSYAFSVYAKADERSELKLTLDSPAFGADGDAFFNLATGTVGTVGSGADDAYIQKLADGWFRCVLVDTATATITKGAFLLLSSGSETTSYTGDGSSGLHSWGWQMEIGEFATSHIPTVASTVTRPAEDVRYDNTSEVLVEAAEGTVIIVVVPDFDIADLTSPVTAFDLSTALAGVKLRANDFGDKWEFIVRSGGSTVANVNSSTRVPIRGVPQVIMVTWKLNDFRIAVDGVQTDSDSAGAAPTAQNVTFFIGQENNNSRQWFGLISHLLIFNRALTLRQGNDVIKTWIQPISPRIRMAA